MQQDYSIEATGTRWTVSLWAPEDKQQDCHDLWQSCLVLMKEFEDSFSRFSPDSFLRNLSGVTGTFDVPKEFSDMLRIYEEINKVSDGAFTPLGARLLSDMGYDENYSFDVKQEVAEVPEFSDAVTIRENNRIEITMPVDFDFGALGKGFLADKVLKNILEHVYVTKVLVNAGGDLLHWDKAGNKARIGLENPDNHEQVVGVYELGNGALASSAPSRRTWTDKEGNNARHHIFDPASGMNPDTLKAAWVVHDSLAWADGLATALFVCDKQESLIHFDLEYFIIKSDNSFVHSPQFNYTLT